ncbi:FRG domain-containing protein [Pseudomonas wadenswilerensis]|uniref:FRG domain protein n=1 Tax=Pseudomonas wadenswilerensis TaxID=1785161 RepID=A0A380T3F6_9PSED|nr:FRG domain-containing protein [Pseudomonas wadenswilerensis]SUQ64130.1 FRG domain protein [Pseudomonas wadenswilerensis]
MPKLVSQVRQICLEKSTLVAKVPEKQITKFSEYVKHLETLQGDFPGAPLWYRGSNNKDHNLVPGLYRHQKSTSSDEIGKLERELIARFRQRSMPFSDKVPQDDWGVLFYMQHHRIPTRLLDWSENPFIAFYFAVANAAYTKDVGGVITYTKDAVVWVLNPTTWNKHALDHVSYDGGILLTIDDEMKGYHPESTVGKMNNHPVAMYGIHNSPRIVAQRGVFTVSGQMVSGLDELYDQHRYPRKSLQKLVIPKENISALRESLFLYGITESVVYPDLDGLALEIKRFYKFEV